jgi:polysaccharide export outer membrane protein
MTERPKKAIRRLGIAAASVAAMAMAVGCATFDSGEGYLGKSPVVDRVVIDTAVLYEGQQPALPEEAVTPVIEEGRDTETTLEEARKEVFDYHVGAGDVLEFRSFDDEYLSRQVTVRYDGFISLPLVSDIYVADATRDEATARVREAYSGIFVDPQVSLVVVEVNSKSYYVMGDVSNPHIYTYTRPITLLDAINTAGGMRVSTRGGDSYVGAQGQLTKAYIIRRAGGERMVNEYDLRGLRNPGAHPSDAAIFPGDIVYIPEGINLVYLIGSVSRPDVYELTEGMGVLELMARAGGPAESIARMNHALLIRELDPTTTEILQLDLRVIMQTGKDIPLKPGDVIYVPRKPLVHMQEFVGRFTGTISPMLDLYQQAYETYYTKDRYDRLFDEDMDNNSLLNVIEGVASFGWSGLLQ